MLAHPLLLRILVSTSVTAIYLDCCKSGGFSIMMDLWVRSVALVGVVIFKVGFVTLATSDVGGV